MTTLGAQQAAPDRRPIRFIAFGLAALVGFSGLTARLVYLQVAQGHEYAALSETNHVVEQPVPAPRGLIYDRTGKLLVTNVPSFTVKIRPADLPLDQRDRVVGQLASLLSMDPADINQAIDSNPGSPNRKVKSWALVRGPAAAIPSKAASPKRS